VPLVAMRTEQTAAAPLYAAAGVGPALVPANMITPGFHGHLIRPCPPITRPVHVFTRTVPDAVDEGPHRLHAPPPGAGARARPAGLCGGRLLSSAVTGLASGSSLHR